MMMHAPRKRFGQHFLHDPHVIQEIIAALNPQANEQLVEIGPGQGALTLPLLKEVKKLEAIELDRDLIPLLKEKCAALGKLIVYPADVLRFDFNELKTSQPMRVFGNLPYNISTPLIFHLLTFTNVIHDMLFMLQKEVADRLAAPVDSEHYGRLSVMVQYRCAIELLFDVSPDAFYPPPKVTSSIVRIMPYQSPKYQVKDEALFARIVKESFGQRRKTLRKSLQKIVTDADWERIPIASNLRPENLSITDFIAIADALVRT